MSKTLFKEAIAEAKSVREAAIANAKKSLEESLTPHLKSMLAARLAEMDGDVPEEEEEELDEVKSSFGGLTPAPFKAPKAPVMEEEEEEEAEDGTEEHEAGETPEEEEEEHEEGGEEAGEIEAGEEEEKEVGDLSVEEFKDLIRDIIAQEMGGAGQPGEEEFGNDLDAGDIEGMGDEQGADEEEINLDELLRELEGSKEDSEMQNELEDTKEELQEAVKVINTLRGELQEINLLNSKLLYVNKIFKSNNLTESQKVNVITAFDRAESVKEAKLVYETVAKSVNVKAAKPATIKEHRGSASKAIGANPSSNIISEVSDTVRRMQKLAGILK